MVGILLLSLLSTPLALLTPLPLKIAVDSVLGSQPIPHFLEVVVPVDVTHSSSAVLALTIGLVLTIALLSQLQGLASSLLQAYTGEKLDLDFRAQLFRHVQRLSLSYHDAQGTADSTYRIQYDASAIWYIAIDGVIPFVTASLYTSFDVLHHPPARLAAHPGCSGSVSHPLSGLTGLSPALS
jgi:ATP-binding cassette subfamily B protein